MLIREATADDALAIANLHADSWQSAYRGILSDDYLDRHAHDERRSAWQKRFSETPRKIWVLVASDAQKLAGFVCVVPDEDSVYGSFLDNLHVAPALTGKGIGRRLLSEAARRLASDGTTGGLYFWVLEQNLRARRFYERAGATIVGSASHLMPDGQTIRALRCHWPAPASLIL